MIIAYIYNFQAYPPKGGQQRHAYELVQGFIAHSHTVRVLDDPNMPNAENYAHHQIKEFLSCIDILYVRIDGRSVRNSTTEEISKACEAPIVWEVNAPGNETLAYSWLGDKLSGRPESKLRTFRRLMHAYRKYPSIFLEELTRRKLSIKVKKHICVTSALEKYSTIKLRANNTAVIPNGATRISDQKISKLKRPSSPEPKKPFTVLYSGSAMFPWQGLNYINDVTEFALKHHPDMRFVFCIPGESDKIIKRENTVIKEALAHEEIISEILQSDVCLAIYPEYTWSPWGLHNSPMKLYEYFSCGAATITSNIGQMKELFEGKEVTLLTENSSQDILRNILFIKNDQSLKKKLQANAYNIVEKEMNWNRVVTETLKHFNSTIPNKSITNN